MSDWKYDVEEVGEEADPDPETEPEHPELPPIEPESPSLEGALFVLLGVVATILVLARIAGLFG